MDEARMARTESAFREVNEAIARTAERFEVDDAHFICECSDAACADRIPAELDDYEEVRSEPTRFLHAPGHRAPGVELVVEETGDYDVVEKRTRTMRRIVRRLDPRTRAD